MIDALYLNSDSENRKLCHLSVTFVALQHGIVTEKINTHHVLCSIFLFGCNPALPVIMKNLH